MSWLSNALRKSDVGKKVAKTFRVPKKHRRRWEEAWTRPSGWRNWKPFKDRGLGLGKLFTGVAQALTPYNEKYAKQHEKFELMASEQGEGSASSFGGFTKWLGMDTQEFDRRAEDIYYGKSQEWADWQDKWTGGSDDLTSLTDEDIYRIFEGGDNADIKGFLKMYGAEDIQDTYLDWVRKNMFNVKDARARSLNKLLKGKQSTIDEFSKNLMSEKREGSSYGTGEWNQDSTIDELMLKLHTEYGDAPHQATANVVDDILTLVDQ